MKIRPTRQYEHGYFNMALSASDSSHRFLALDGPISLCLILRSSQTQELQHFDHTASTAEKQLQDVSSVSRNALPLAPRGLADLISPLSVLVKVKHQAHPHYTSLTPSESPHQQKKRAKTESLTRGRRLELRITHHNTTRTRKSIHQLQAISRSDSQGKR